LSPGDSLGRPIARLSGPRTLAETSDCRTSAIGAGSGLLRVVGETSMSERTALTEDSAIVGAIERTFALPAEDVFDPGRRELSALVLPSQDCRADRVGGSAWADGPRRDAGPLRRHVDGGDYTEIDRPHRLAFDRIHSTIDPIDRQTDRYRVTERDCATTGVFLYSNISQARRRHAQYDGWVRPASTPWIGC